MLSIEPLSLSLSFFLSPSIFIASRSRDLFHFVTPISKVVCRPRLDRRTSEGDRVGGSSERGERDREREIGRVKISRVPRPRDYGISGPMVIYGPRREGKKKRYSNEHASSNRYILSSSSSSAFSPRARLSTSAHGSGADPATLSITLSARPLVDDVPFPLRVVREFARAPLRSARVGIIVCGQPPVREFVQVASKVGDGRKGNEGSSFRISYYRDRWT